MKATMKLNPVFPSAADKHAVHGGPHGIGRVACAVLMPHAPILVPEVGGERGGAAVASCQA
ncbi:MAG TPA: hypothetical protein VFF11_00750, partial [Candidatus Binatia bacterium]|nr:hypothetical protein [Candidatus Binatia bacterium]